VKSPNLLVRPSALTAGNELDIASPFTPWGLLSASINF